MGKTKQQRKNNTKQEPVAEVKSLSKNSISLEDKVCIGLLIVVLLFIYVIRSKFLEIPFERDEGIYSYFGKLVLEGKIPYKDFYEMKFPGLFYLYAFMVKFFGETIQGVHTGFMYLNIITTVFIYTASRKLFSPISGIISAITFAVLSMNPKLSGFTVQSEHGVAFFISMGIMFYAMSKQNKSWYWFLLMGIALGSAFLVKTSAVFMGLWGGIIIVLEFIIVTKGKNFKNFLTNITLYSIGALSVIGFSFLLIISKGSLNDMIYWVFEYAGKYAGGITLETGLEYLKYTRKAIAENYMFFWLHCGAALILMWYKGVSNSNRIIGISLLLFSFATTVPGFYFYGHYFIQLIPGFSVVAGLSAFSVFTITKSFFKNKLKLVSYGYLVLFVLLTYAHINTLKAYYLKPNYDLILRQVYGNNPFPEAKVIGDFINNTSQPEDEIVLIGSEPQIYFYTQKKCPSRHAYFTAMVANVDEHKEWQREFVKDVENSEPRYFVFFNHRISLMVQPNTDNFVFEWANKYINEHYKLVGLVDMVDGIYSKYVWNEQVVNYQPQAKSIIYIFERKD